MHVRKLLCLCFCLLLASSAFAAKFTMLYERHDPDQAKTWSVFESSAANMALLYYLNTATQNMNLEQRGNAYQYLLNDMNKKFDLALADQHLYRLQVIEQDDRKTVLGFEHKILADNEVTIAPRLNIKKVYLGSNEIKGQERLVIIVQDENDKYGALFAFAKGVKVSERANCSGTSFNVELISLDPEITGREEIQIGKINEGSVIDLSNYFSFNNLGIASIRPLSFKRQKEEKVTINNLSWIERHR